MFSRLLSSRAVGAIPRSLLQCRYATEKVVMPALSPTMEAGTIANWKMKVGDFVKPGDVLCQVETDKATLDFEWIGDEGYLAKIMMEAGSDACPVGTPIALLVEEESEIAAAQAEEVAATPAPAAPAAPAATPAATPAAPAAAAPVSSTPSAPASFEAGSTAKVRASPAAMSMIAKHIVGTGPGGRIVQKDVDAFLASKGGAPASASSESAVSAEEYTDVPASMMRKVIAGRLTESKATIPHFYLTMDVAVGPMKDMVKALNEAGNGDYKITLNDFIIKATALACKKVPQSMNQWQGDTIREYNRVDISVAVATPTGLITPIVFNADLKGLTEISSDVKNLAGGAKAGTLTPDQYTGGTFTISNLGAFGIKHFTAIINPPQSCILAVGAAQPNGMMSVTLSCDHRTVDGAVGAMWLQAFKKAVENPTSLML